jgi:nucleoid-associated protein YgaU
MKRNDIIDIPDKIFFQNYENLFKVYQTDNGDYFYNILRNVNIPIDLNSEYYHTYITAPGDTWTLIAYEIYDDVRLWWILCLVNKIKNPLLLPEPGTELKILTPTIAQQLLMTIQGA